jgi:hypothetical protein
MAIAATITAASHRFHFIRIVIAPFLCTVVQLHNYHSILTR